MNRFFLATLLCSLVSLASCGGGGGESSNSQPELSGTFEYAADVDVLLPASVRAIAVTPTPTALNCVLAGGNLPPGLSLRPDCSMDGIPTEIGISKFSLAVTASGYRGSATANVTVGTLGPSFYATTGHPDSLILERSAGNYPAGIVLGPNLYPGDELKFSIISGRIPNGMSLDSATGQLHGTPLEIGNFTATLGLTLSRNGRTVNIRSDAVGREVLTVIVGAPIRTMTYPSPCCVFQVTGSRSTAVEFYPPLQTGDKATFELDNPPNGFQIDATTGVITGQSSTVGSMDVSVSAIVTTSNGATYRVGAKPQIQFIGFLPYYRRSSNGDTNAYLSGPNENGYPVIVNIRTLSGVEVTFTPDGIFAGEPGDVYAFELLPDTTVATGVPTWLTIDKSSGRITSNRPQNDPQFQGWAYASFLVRMTTLRAGNTYVATQRWQLNLF